MNWQDFIAGKISVYCGDRSGAEQFLDECDAHGLSTVVQRANLRKFTNFFAYRCADMSLMLYVCDYESEWSGQLGCGSVTEVVRYSDIQSESVRIDTLDGFLSNGYLEGRINYV